MPDPTAADVMTRDVVTVAPETTLREAARLMAKHGISALPVVKGGVAVGILSDTDLIQPGTTTPRRGDWWVHSLAGEVAIAPEFTAALQNASRSVGQAMQGDLAWVPESAPLPTVAKLMSEEGVRRLLVLREGAVVGIVSRRDLVKAMAKG